jgi:hypothetical protein
VLVDARDNIITSSSKTSWYSIKQNMLDALSNDSLENINSIFSEKSIISDEAKRHASILLLESKYEEVTFADEWDKNAIDERTMLLLKNAWTNLNQWLK